MINYVSRLLMGNEQRESRAPQLDDRQATNDTTQAEEKDTKE